MSSAGWELPVRAGVCLVLMRGLLALAVGPVSPKLQHLNVEEDLSPCESGREEVDVFQGMLVLPKTDCCCALM